MKNEVLQSTAEEVSCHKTGNKDNALKVGLKIAGVVEIKNKMLTVGGSKFAFDPSGRRYPPEFIVCFS